MDIQKEIIFCQVPPHIVIYIQKLNETQLQPSARCWVSLCFLFDVAPMRTAEGCATFQGFGCIRSTQPTGLFYP